MGRRRFHRATAEAATLGIVSLASVLSYALASVIAPSSANAQESGSEVGGAPARRRVTKMPVLKRFVEATYPPEKRAAGVQADVILTLDVSATGEVVRVVVARSSGSADFDDAAVAAARAFELEPAEVDQKPAPSRITYRYAFVIAPVATSVAVPPGSIAPPTDTAPPTTSAPAGASASQSETEVRVRAAPRARREAVVIAVRAEDARRVAGTQGDVLKVVQNLPGVSRPPLASGQLVVWGAAPKDTRIYVDGVEVPALYHGSGLRSVIGSDFVSSVDLVPGAYGAEYGRGLGGLVRVETRALRKDGVHGYVSADTLDASAGTSAPLGDHVRFGVAGRVSWLDRVLSAVSAPDIGDYFPIPRYSDYQAKATVDLRRNESLDAVLLGSHDDLVRTVPSPDPARVRSESTSSHFHRVYLRYVRTTEDGDAISVTPFTGYDHDELATSFGGAPTRIETGSWKYGARASYRTRVHRRVTLTGGVDALGESGTITRSGSLTLPSREGDVTVFGQTPSGELTADTWSTSLVDVGPHVVADVQLGPVTITPGVRLDTFLIEGSRETPRVGLTPAVGFSRLEATVDPRIAVRWDATRELAVVASGGTYHQGPDAQDLSAVFGTPELGLSRATHVSLGESLHVTPSLALEVTTFGKTMNELVVRSRLEEPKLARALVQNGEGRSWGIQMLLRQEVWRGFFGWVSYTISRSERRYAGDEHYRPFDYDQPHVLAVVGSQEIGRWTFGARFRYASGAPRTPVLGSFYDARDDEYQPVFGAQNALRLPAFYQLDAKIERVVPLGRGVRVVTYVDVQNVTFHENREEIVYSADFRRKGYITGLPTLAIVGGRVEF